VASAPGGRGKKWKAEKRGRGGTACAGFMRSQIEVRARIVKKSNPPPADAHEIYPDTVTHTLYENLEVLDGAYKASDVLAVEWIQKN